MLVNLKYMFVRRLTNLKLSECTTQKSHITRPCFNVKIGTVYPNQSSSVTNMEIYPMESRCLDVSSSYPRNNSILPQSDEFNVPTTSFTNRVSLSRLRKMSTISGPTIFNTLFIPGIHEKFRKQISLTNKFEKMIKDLGGRIVLDHAATRVMTQEHHDLITRIARGFGLEVNEHYKFEEKKLTAVDLQFKGNQGFKWFSTLIHYNEFSQKTIDLINEDLKQTTFGLSEKSEEYLKKLESKGGLLSDEAESFVKDLLENFFVRQGPPLKREAYDAVLEESSESVNALLIGCDFNHIAYDLNKLQITDWYGLEVIEVLSDYLSRNGFEMLPQIQGVASGVLRQTSTKAEMGVFKLDDGSKVENRAKFLEFIQRGPQRDDSGRIIFKEFSQPALFQGFLSANTVKLYDATKQK